MGLDEDFAHSGPKHMMVKNGSASSPPTMIDFNWDSPEHRRCIAACAVKGCYIMAMDANRNSSQAPAWWESFHLRRLRVLDGNLFIHGAIFEYAPPAGVPRHPSAPDYVVAFRGTMPGQCTCIADLHLDVKILFNRQHRCERYRLAREEVGELLDGVVGSRRGGAVVWLAGHSLGASIALDVGRDMMTKRRWNLPTFLFNPPQVSLAPVLNLLRMTEKAKRDLYGLSYMVKGLAGKTLQRSHEQHMMEVFERLARWEPELFVHERDLICQGFIDHFEQRQKMLEGLPITGLAEVGMKLSFRDMMWASFRSIGRKNGREHEERPHLLPSAMLWKNSGDGNAHDLQQWWKPDSELNLSCRLYRCCHEA